MSESATPPEEIPADLVDAYTIGGRIPVRSRYFDNTYSEPSG